MPKSPKVVSIDKNKEVGADSKAHSLNIVVGSQRIALDIFLMATLPPRHDDQPAAVMPINKMKRRRSSLEDRRQRR